MYGRKSQKRKKKIDVNIWN